MKRLGEVVLVEKVHEISKGGRDAILGDVSIGGSLTKSHASAFWSAGAEWAPGCSFLH
jgi:hypothetical protein